MTEARAESVPAWDQADRLRKALRTAGVGVGEMAEYLGVTRVTVGAYVNGRGTPKVQTLRLWAIRCGVPYEWLKDGVVAPTGPDGWAPRGSNPQPTDYKSDAWAQILAFPELRLAATA